MLTKILLPTITTSVRSTLSKRISVRQQLCHNNYSSASSSPSVSSKPIIGGDNNDTAGGKAVLPGRFNNKVAIVTASSYGFGRSMARRLYSEGANVVICSRKQVNVDEAIRHIKKSCDYQLASAGVKNSVSGIVCHVGNAEHRKRLVDFTLDNYGQIDCFVSNAGVNPHVGPMESVTEAQMDKIYDINFKSVVQLTQLLLPHLRQSSLKQQQQYQSDMENKDKVVAHKQINGRGASVVFISTVAAHMGIANIGTYAASKAALTTLSRVLAKECASDNIRFNCVAPGPFETKFGTVLKEDELFFDIGSATILKRFGQDFELDGLVAYLLSDEASYITGETYNVAGGLR